MKVPPNTSRREDAMNRQRSSDNGDESGAVPHPDSVVAGSQSGGRRLAEGKQRHGDSSWRDLSQDRGHCRSAVRSAGNRQSGTNDLRRSQFAPHVRVAAWTPATEDVLPPQSASRSSSLAGTNLAARMRDARALRVAVKVWRVGSVRSSSRRSLPRWGAATR